MSSASLGFELAAMGSREDWLLRPVAAGMTGYEQIHRPELDLADFAAMNEKLDVDLENEQRYADWSRRGS